MQGVLIGQIVNVHGIKGEVKVYPYTDDIDNLCKKIKKIYFNENLGEGYKASCRIQKNMLLMKIQGIDTVEKAEDLRDKYIYISEDALDKLEKDSYYVKDLIGCEIIDIKDNSLVGILNYIFNTGANDVYEVITSEDTKIYLPAIKQVIKKVDIKTRRLPGFKTSIEQKVSKIESQAKSKQTRLEKMQNALGERPYEEGEIYYKLAANNLFGKMLINIKNVSKNYGQKIIFDNINLTISNGEKIALIGDNGSGKTTFIKMLLNETNFDVQIIKNLNIKFACLSQDAFNYESSLTIIELSREFGDLQTQFLTNLINMGFRREMFSKKISTLSSGEKMKLKLNELILGNFNFLILDEPTNNLDISNKIFLEKVLSNFKGNCLIVSHDRAFIDNICTRKIKIENKKLIEIN